MPQSLPFSKFSCIYIHMQTYTPHVICSMHWYSIHLKAYGINLLSFHEKHRMGRCTPHFSNSHSTSHFMLQGVKAGISWHPSSHGLLSFFLCPWCLEPPHYLLQVKTHNSEIRIIISMLESDIEGFNFYVREVTY